MLVKVNIFVLLKANGNVWSVSCGQCPAAVSPDLLLGRSRKYCDEGKAMCFELGACVWRGAVLLRDAQQFPRHLQWPGAHLLCAAVTQWSREL